MRALTVATERAVLNLHGAKQLPGVIVDSYNLEIRDEDGFVGDKASRVAFHEMLEKWREPLRKLGADPLGEKPTEEIEKKKLDKLLTEGDPEAGGIVHSAIEDFAQALAKVVKRFLKASSWRETEAIVIGGGFRASRVGELAVGRAGVLLKADDFSLDMKLISNHPDEAGLVGIPHLMPSWMLEAFDGLLAVDIGGSNIRTGIVETKLKKAKDLSKAQVHAFNLWRHADEETNREAAVQRLIDMLQELLVGAKKEEFKLAPVVGIGCPGIIGDDGSIEAGAQNLPGNWESSRFNLPDRICKEIPRIGDHETHVAIHNDAVVQGLSELPNMQEYEQWGVLTIGTGLGNARFTNRNEAAGSG